MATKVSKTAIGAFVLGGIALLVVAVLVLGAGKLFTTEHTYITYFSGSVKGLNVGSPVMFRGVKVGSVSDISIQASPQKAELFIPVVFQLEPAKFKGIQSIYQRDPKAIEIAVKEHGLRTQLQMMSFVTGQLMVALEFMPGTAARFVGLNGEYPEIPSVPTPLEQLQKTLEDLPFREIVQNLNTTIALVQRLVSSIDARKAGKSLEKSMQDLQRLIRNVNTHVEPLVESIRSTSGTAESTLKEANQTMAAARGHMIELMDSTKSTLDSAQAALKQSEETLQSISGDSRVMVELNRTLRELSATAKSLRRLSDYLERHPESLLRGKEIPK